LSRKESEPFHPDFGTDEDEQAIRKGSGKNRFTINTPNVGNNNMHQGVNGMPWNYNPNHPHM
jgi:hypothetical protein